VEETFKLVVLFMTKLYLFVIYRGLALIRHVDH
jgi:hypothetical protein